MKNIHPTIANTLTPFMGSMGMFSASPTADAEDYFDGLENTYTAEVDFLGLKLTAELNRGSDHLVDVLGEDGTCWYELLSEKALRKIRTLALEATQ